MTMVELLPQMPLLLLSQFQLVIWRRLVNPGLCPGTSLEPNSNLEPILGLAAILPPAMVLSSSCVGIVSNS